MKKTFGASWWMCAGTQAQRGRFRALVILCHAGAADIPRKTVADSTPTSLLQRPMYK